MIRLVALGIWVCAVTLASGYVTLSWQSEYVGKPENLGLFGNVATLKTRMMSVPIIAEGAVQGYIVAQFAFAVDSGVLRQLSIKPDLILVDEAIRTIYSDEGIDFRNVTRQDLPGLATELAENANQRVGAKLISEVFIEELNYVPKDMVRKGLPGYSPG